MSLFLCGLGTAVPREKISQRDAAELALEFCSHTAAQRRLLPVLYRRCGVETRNSVLLESANGPPLSRQSFFDPVSADADRGPTTAARMRRYETDAPPLAIAAARSAIADAGLGLDPREITHLVTVSCSGFSAPGIDITLIQALSLAAGTARTHVGFMGCHGALNGLRVAKAFTDGRPDACVLLVAVELCSLHHQYGWQPDRIVSNALFADGAAAVVCRGRSKAPTDCWQLTSSASTLISDSLDAMSWRIGDHGFEMTLSSEVPDLIRRELKSWLVSWLDDNGLGIEDVEGWAIHPGGPRILAACADVAGLAPGQLAASTRVLADFGNMSSPTVLFILERLRRQGVQPPVVMLGFGPGLAVEAALVQ